MLAIGVDLVLSVGTAHALYDQHYILAATSYDVSQECRSDVIHLSCRQAALCVRFRAASLCSLVTHVTDFVRVVPCSLRGDAGEHDSYLRDQCPLQ